MFCTYFAAFCIIFISQIFAVDGSGQLEDVRDVSLASGDSNNKTCEHPWRNRSGEFNSSCEFVKMECSDIAALVDYLSFIVCDYPRYKWFTYSVLILWLMYLISLLATTADYFFVPPLNLLAQKLKLSPSVAGITLLALGNGAPDVFAAYAALQKANDLSLELSALLGASIFILTVVLGSVILVSNVSSNTIRRTDFARDIVAYIIVVSIVIGVSMDGNIYLYESVIFLAAYIAYIGVVVALGYILRAKRKSTVQQPLFSESNKSSNTTPIVSLNEPSDPENNFSLAGLSWPRNSNWAVKVQFIVEYPVSILRWLTVPSCDEEWDMMRWIFAILCPIPASLLLLIAAEGWDGFTMYATTTLPVYAVIIIAGAPISLILFGWFLYKWRFCTRGSLDPGSVVLFFSGVVAFITSVAWMNIQANELVAVLQTFGTVFDVSLAVLGVTVLAIGNSVGDWVADTAVARQGKPAMGVSSCFGSPLLNDVLGLGISLTAYTARHFPHPFEFNVKSSDFKTVIFCWIILCLTLLIHWLAFPLLRFTPPRWYSLLLFVLYAFFMLFNILDVTNIVKFAF
ncbi:uncharacterized protein LOC134183932 [Corticium candelabrum]|uniref:uncharacterized protein LOC134183932 n=1 Tax=Corticium candelabrum TaxID=121492 RepID=UPI002E35FA5A|nr:uncharacterized protein LOC134183932 [Corticium candelabrum]